MIKKDFNNFFFQKNIPLVNAKNTKILNSSTGKIAVALIQDFLKNLSLDFTLSVFNPEVNFPVSQQSHDRVSLCKMLPENLRPNNKGEFQLVWDGF